MVPHAEIRWAIALCRANSLRLLEGARAVLEGDGSPGLAYLLWFHGIEEHGKGVLLSRRLTSAGSPGGVRLSKSWLGRLLRNHIWKFGVGRHDIPALRSTGLGHWVEVTRLGSGRPVARDPLDSNRVLVLSSGTGTYEDLTSEHLEATFDLRNELLYVTCDDEGRNWRRPEQVLEEGGTEFRWKLVPADLGRAIEQAITHIGGGATV